MFDYEQTWMFLGHIGSRVWYERAQLDLTRWAQKLAPVAHEIITYQGK
jgi:hypothetical protein